MQQLTGIRLTCKLIKLLDAICLFIYYYYLFRKKAHDSGSQLQSESTLIEFDHQSHVQKFKTVISEVRWLMHVIDEVSHTAHWHVA